LDTKYLRLEGIDELSMDDDALAVEKFGLSWPIPMLPRGSQKLTDVVSRDLSGKEKVSISMLSSPL